MLIQWYHNYDRNSSYFSSQAGRVLLETAVWEGDIDTVLKQLESGANANYYLNKVIPF